MRKFVANSSFLNRKPSIKLKKFFSYSKPDYFPLRSSLQNFILSNFLGVQDAEIIAIDSTIRNGEHVLCEKLLQDGLLYYYGEGTQYNDYPKFNYAGLLFHIDKNHSEEIQTAWGYSMPYEAKAIAFSKAIGESIERQASYYIPDNKTATFPSLHRGDASHLFEHIPKFTTAQKERNPLLARSADDLKNLLGFKASSVTGGKTRFFPFEAFYWGYTAEPAQKIFQHATTSGSGGGKTHEEALLSGCCELIERDLVMLYWLSGIQAPIIDNSTIPGDIGTYVKHCKDRYGLDIYFLNLSYDITIQTIACVVIDPILHRVTMGAKTGFVMEKNLEGSLLEALAVLSTTRHKDEVWEDEELKTVLEKPPFNSIVSRKARVNMYSNQYGVTLIKNVFLQGKVVSYASCCIQSIGTPKKITDQLAHIMAQFKKLVLDKGPGYHVYVAKFKSSWLKELSFHAVHVFVPCLMKLHLNDEYATPLAERLVAFAKDHGKTITSEADINPLPHFFP